MRKALLFCVALGSVAISLQAKTSPKAVNFSGNWVLDTGQTKNVPDGLSSYTIAVKQNGERLEVQTELKGALRTTASPDETSPQTHASVGPPGGYPGEGPVGSPRAPVGGIGPEVPPGRVGAIGGVGVPEGGIGPAGGTGMPAGGVGPIGGPQVPGGAGGPTGEGIPGSTEPSPQRREQVSNRQARTALAFSICPRIAFYELAGGKSNVQLRDASHTEATAKATWMKRRNQLVLVLAGGHVTLKEQWKFSKDGRDLLIDRTVHTPDGSGSVHLVFEKEAARP